MNLLQIPFCTFTLRKAGGEKTSPPFLNLRRSTSQEGQGPLVQTNLLSHCLFRYLSVLGFFMGLAERKAFLLSDYNEWYCYA